MKWENWGLEHSYCCRLGWEAPKPQRMEQGDTEEAERGTTSYHGHRLLQLWAGEEQKACPLFKATEQPALCISSGTSHTSAWLTDSTDSNFTHTDRGALCKLTEWISEATKAMDVLGPWGDWSTSSFWAALFWKTKMLRSPGKHLVDRLLQKQIVRSSHTCQVILMKHLCVMTTTPGNSTHTSICIT